MWVPETRSWRLTGGNASRPWGELSNQRGCWRSSFAAWWVGPVACGCGQLVNQQPEPDPQSPPGTDSEPADGFAAEFPYPRPVPNTARRGNVSQRLARLGNVRGRPRDEIVALLGPPNSISSTGDGGELLQWQKISAYSGSWHYALIFDRHGICGGITHQFSQ